MMAMNYSKLIFSLFVGSFLMVAQAQISDASHVAQALKRSITLDDDMSDWEGLPQYSIALNNTELAEPVTQPGFYRVAFDDHFFYVYASFMQTQDSLSMGLSEDAEEWWLADTFEVFVRIEGQEALHYALSPEGIGFTNFLTDNDFQTHSSISEDSWSIQVAFPLVENSLPSVQANDSWELKVGRGNRSAKEYSLWPMGGDFLAEDNYGLVYFTEQIESDSLLFDRLKR